MNKFAVTAAAATLTLGVWCAETNAAPAAAAESASAELVTRTFVLKYVKATEVADSLNRLCEKLKLTEAAVAFPESHSVAVAGPKHVVAACEKIVGDIDRKPKQVYVEARFFDLMASDLAGVGVDWSMLASGAIPGANPLTAAGNGTIEAAGGRGLSDTWKYTGTIGIENLKLALAALSIPSSPSSRPACRRTPSCPANTWTARRRSRATTRRKSSRRSSTAHGASSGDRDHDHRKSRLAILESCSDVQETAVGRWGQGEKR